MTGVDLAATFLENAAKAAAGVHTASGVDGLRDVLARIVPAGAQVYCPGTTEAEKAVEGLFPNRVADYAAAAVTVEEVYGGIAETGTLVCSSEGGRAVQAGLLPSHHVAIVRREMILATLTDLFSAVAAAPPTNLTLVTGPSRTADIELTLAIGVHGPERLDIIVV
ncbi:MAG: lactate utilization protein [Deltaproteobacteria bacterium]|nr:lactate utilization protein [Deltaproteobacteria bacterium]